MCVYSSTYTSIIHSIIHSKNKQIQTPIQITKVNCSFINRFADQTQAPSCTGNTRVERASLFQTLDQINFIS